MSFLVLHMDKFKKEAVRGIQSHNKRERRSHSNPDIEYGRSSANYELHENAAANYAEAVQKRIDDLLLVKAVRKDAVHLCGLIVSSDSEFFKRLSPQETRRFFAVCTERLTELVGKENVISATVHMDEKTPHLHFLHVPVTKDGRLNANSIYTRESLKSLQDTLPQHLRSQGFAVQRGVEQTPDSAKKHLDTREFKQQQNALAELRQKGKTAQTALEQTERQEAELQKRIHAYEQQAREAEKALSERTELPEASIFTFKSALEQAARIIRLQKEALTGKAVLEKQYQYSQENLREVRAKSARFEAAYDAEQKRGLDAIGKILAEHDKTRAELEAVQKFVRQPEVNALHVEYLQEERRRAEKKAAEQKARELEETRQREEKERQSRMEAEAREKALEEQRQREREEYESRRSRHRMGMGR